MICTLTNQNFLGQKISFIKHLRTTFVGMSLKDAKAISDNFGGVSDFEEVVEVDVELNHYEYEFINRSEYLKVSVRRQYRIKQDKVLQLLRQAAHEMVDLQESAPYLFTLMRLIDSVENYYEVTNKIEGC